MSEAIKKGMSRYMLYSMRDQGVIECVSRGVYRLAELPPITNPDLVIVSLRYPNAVICLISALSFHEITTQIPHEVSMAVSRGTRIPTLTEPPINVHTFSDQSFSAGIETHQIDGVAVRVYNPEKSIVDCFKFRNKIGMDVFLEAVKLYKSRKQVKVNQLLLFAKICRIDKMIMPYLEALL